ncbi:MAG: hypothetical protein ABL911_00635 [Gallionella sp.]|nr:hypothetical protein [Gallionella sp.]
MKFTPRHSRAGGNPVKNKIPAKRGNYFSRYAKFGYRWIPACAGMTVV